MESPTVSIVVVNYNGASILEHFLQSVRSCDYAALEILVVDNASIDDSVARLEPMEDVVVVASPSNLGFGRGCNLGAEQARGDLLLFANPDVELYPDAISVMVDDLLETPGAAVVCATLIEPGMQHDRERRVEDVASMAAAAMLVERAHFERIGGFDPEIFLYSEDTDLCFRTWLVGRRVLKAWNAVAVHELAGSGGGGALQRGADQEWLVHPSQVEGLAGGCALQRPYGGQDCRARSAPTRPRRARCLVVESPATALHACQAPRHSRRGSSRGQGDARATRGRARLLGATQLAHAGSQGPAPAPDVVLVTRGLLRQCRQ